DDDPDARPLLPRAAYLYPGDHAHRPQRLKTGGGRNQAYFGSETAPRNSSAPVSLSRIAQRKGRSTTMRNGFPSSMMALVATATIVAAAASVPFSSVLTNVLCRTLPIQTRFPSAMPEKSARLRSNATSMPSSDSGSLRSAPYSHWKRG